ncbi:MAG: hypothetical protein JSV89_13365 [Spirochaetaceae bacterium]|nr:MAG: hypothetical protein JSV89_13365 [Spirochaetaceae bacterium]
MRQDHEAEGLGSLDLGIKAEGLSIASSSLRSKRAIKNCPTLESERTTKVEQHHVVTEGRYEKIPFFGVLIFLIAVGALPVWSFGKAEMDPGEQENVYFIHHPEREHVQVLGGQSTHAVNGLDRAINHARFMVDENPATKPKDDADDVVRKKKK